MAVLVRRCSLVGEHDQTYTRVWDRRCSDACVGLRDRYQGTTQSVTLHTDPEVATCDVTRDFKNVASLSATHGQVLVDKAWGSIDVSCRKSGHLPTEIRVDSEVQGWNFGNILLGGSIGFEVDAASGAMRLYP